MNEVRRINPISQAQVFITVGQETELMISVNNQLVMRKVSLGTTLQSIHLGAATKKRIEELQSYLESLKVHCE